MRGDRLALLQMILLLLDVNGVASAQENMNGDYVYWKTPGAPADKAFPTNFKSYPGGVESFDAYHGPITSTCVCSRRDFRLRRPLSLFPAWIDARTFAGRTNAG